VHPARRCSRTLCLFLAVGAFAFALLCALTPAARAGGQQQQAAVYSHPDPDAVRQEVHDILSDPRYAPRKTFMQWLLERLSRIHRPDRPASGWKKVFWWIVLIWCGLTIIAIVGHILWQLASLLGIRIGGRLRRAGVRRARTPQLESLEQIQARVRELAARRAFQEAVSAMMLALVRWLEHAGLLAFHNSKTSGDYVREYPMTGPGRDEFCEFALAFDRIAYAGEPCDRAAYSQADNLFQRVLKHVEQQPQV